MMDTILVIGFITALSLLLLVVHYSQKRWRWHPEVARKTVHIVMGLSCLPLPLMFTSIYPIWVLVTLTILLLVIVRYTSMGRMLMGNALHSVKRESLGEMWYAIAVALVFTLAYIQQQPILFWIPILILSFSDAAAALIGMRYGQFKFTASDSTKSIEGSTAFSVTCFFLVAFPLAVVSDVSALTVLLISLILALLIMLVEGASWKGIDNLLIPLGSFFLLQNYLGFSELRLAAHTLILIVLISVFLWVRKKTLLDGSALLGAILVTYFYLSVGGLIWLVAPLLYLILYTYFSHRRGQSERYIHDIRSVLSISGLSSLCLLGHLIWPNIIWFAGFNAAFAAQLSITGIARREFYAKKNSQILNASVAWVQGVAFILIPSAFTLLLAGSSAVVYWFILSSIGLVISLMLFIRWQPSMNLLPRDNARWWRQAISGIPPTVLGMLGYTGFITQAI